MSQHFAISLDLAERVVAKGGFVSDRLSQERAPAQIFQHQLVFAVPGDVKIDLFDQVTRAVVGNTPMPLCNRNRFTEKIRQHFLERVLELVRRDDRVKRVKDSSHDAAPIRSRRRVRTRRESKYCSARTRAA